jgi:hypothetical protein
MDAPEFGKLTFDIKDYYSDENGGEYPTHPILGEFSIDDGRYVTVPLWSVLTAAAAAGIVPWIPWSRTFNMQSLFIAMTILAMLCGLVALSG